MKNKLRRAFLWVLLPVGVLALVLGIMSAKVDETQRAAEKATIQSVITELQYNEYELEDQIRNLEFDLEEFPDENLRQQLKTLRTELDSLRSERRKLETQLQEYEK